MLIVVVAVVSLALVAGAAWGVFGKLEKRTEGFLIALAGGALLVSLVTELVVPSINGSGLLYASGGLAAGAIAFSVLDYLIDEKWGSDSGGGLLAAITLDGIPENLALGVALIGAGWLDVTALAGSILLSNLPEAAGGARAMAEGGRAKLKVFGLWSAAAALLGLTAVVGNLALAAVNVETLALIRCFAAGAVVASLATEVFPQAYREDSHWAGVATAFGVILAFFLGELPRF